MLKPLIARFSGPALVTSTNVFGIALTFLRNITIARILGPELFGISVIIATVAAAADLLSDLGWDKFLLQSGDHEVAPAQGVVQLFRLFTGFAVSILVLLCAYPLAVAIRMPQSAWAISSVAIVVLVKSFMHVDYKYRQRHGQFGGEFFVESARALVDLCAAIVVALVFGSYWAMSAGLICGAFISLVVSHLTAQRPYKVEWHSQLAAHLFAFGWPLLLNNFVVYLSGQGDRLLVSIAYSPRVLAVYAACLTMISGPQIVISRATMTLALPSLVRVRSDAARYRNTFFQVGSWSILAAAVVSFPVIAFGSEAVRMIFGRRFNPDAPLIAALVIPQSLNILRTWTMSSLVANASTKLIPLVNLTRVVGLAAAAVLSLRGCPLIVVAYCLTAGEVAGFLVLHSVNRRFVPRGPDDLTNQIVVLGVAWVGAIALQAFATTLVEKSALGLVPLLVVLVVTYKRLVSDKDYSEKSASC